jgi:hypothetical protein
MSCLNCVSAHRRGRFWFCNRCGHLMHLRPEPAQVIPLVRRPAEAPDRRRPPWGPLRDAVTSHPSARAATLRLPAGPEPADLTDAVVVDLDEARRAKHVRP